MTRSGFHAFETSYQHSYPGECKPALPSLKQQYFLASVFKKLNGIKSSCWHLQAKGEINQSTDTSVFEYLSSPTQRSAEILSLIPIYVIAVLDRFEFHMRVRRPGITQPILPTLVDAVRAL